MNFKEFYYIESVGEDKNCMTELSNYADDISDFMKEVDKKVERKKLIDWAVKKKSNRDIDILAKKYSVNRGDIRKQLTGK